MAKAIITLTINEFHMPLTNNVIIKLNEITQLVENKNILKENEVEEIKKIFHGLLKSGEFYNVDEIESWFENEGTWKNKWVKNRISNISHYVQTKFEQNNKFRIIDAENDSCGCGN